MKKIYLILGFVLLALTACPQKPAQTFDELAWFKKGIMLPDGKTYLTIPTGVSTITWNLIQGKPVSFIPAPHSHVWSDISSNPGDVYLIPSLEALDGFPVSPKTSAEISKIIVPAGRARIVFNTTDSVLQVFYGGKWRNFILSE